MGYLQYALVLSLVAFVLVKKWQSDVGKRVLLIGVVLLITLIPLTEITVAGFALGVFGQLSISTSVLLLVALGNQFGYRPDWFNQDRNQLYRAISVFGIIFYPMALGATMFDPYRLGYDPIGIIIILTSASLYLWWRGSRLAAVIIVLSIAMYNLDVLESDNYWDYVIDIYFFIFCFYWTVRDLWRIRATHKSLMVAGKKL